MGPRGQSSRRATPALFCVPVTAPIATPLATDLAPDESPALRLRGFLVEKSVGMSANGSSSLAPGSVSAVEVGAAEADASSAVTALALALMLRAS